MTLFKATTGYYNLDHVINFFDDTDGFNLLFDSGHIEVLDVSSDVERLKWMLNRLAEHDEFKATNGKRFNPLDGAWKP